MWSRFADVQLGVACRAGPTRLVRSGRQAGVTGSLSAAEGRRAGAAAAPHLPRSLRN